MRRFQVALEEAAVERLRDTARRQAVILRQDVSWQDVLRAAADQFLKAESIAAETAGATKTTQKGTR